jgi:nitrilase
MSQSPTLAIVQEPPVFLNLKASLEAAVRHIRKAATDGANIVTFAECWLPGYPVWLDFAPNAAIWDDPGGKALFRLLAENAVVQGDEHLRALQKLADELSIFIVMGTHERAGKTLYNTSFTFSPGADGPMPHRKLIPTYTERMVWGRGDGSTLVAAETPWGNLGNLICWEHWMPLARAAMHRLDETIHIAQWPIVKDMHQVASRHYAFEGRCAVAAAGSYMNKEHILDGFRSLGSNESAAEAMLASMPGENTDIIHKGGSAIIAPNGDYLAEPLYNKSGTLLAEINIQQILEEAMTLDTDGHYSRPDVFDLKVNTSPMTGVSFGDGQETD